MWKKTSMFCLMLICSVILPFSAASANGWQFIGSSYYYWNDAHNKYSTVVPTAKSTGWSVKVQFWSEGSSNYKYQLWEYDPGSGNDDYIDTVYRSDGETAKFWVHDYVDGSNNRAELYIVTPSYMPWAADFYD